MVVPLHVVMKIYILIIDLRVVVRDETFRSFISNKTERPKKWGQVLFIGIEENIEWINEVIGMVI